LKKWLVKLKLQTKEKVEEINMRVIDFLMWLMFLVSSVVSVITVIVTFGMIEYTKTLKPFMNFLPLEICLAATLFLWSINSLYNNYTKASKKAFFYYLIMGSILLGFIFMGVY
jgi:hypothetical protein